MAKTTEFACNPTCSIPYHTSTGGKILKLSSSASPSPSLRSSPRPLYTLPRRTVQGDTAGGGGNAVAPNKANGAAAVSGEGSSAHERSGSGGVGGGGGAGDRGDGGGEGGPAGGAADGGGVTSGGAGELKLAMAGGRAGADGSAEGGGGGDGGGGGGSATGGGPAGSENGVSGARRRNTMEPMTVLTRDQAAQDTYNPLLYGCRSVENYERIEFIDEGAYGKVYCALNKTTGEVVALKQVRVCVFVTGNSAVENRCGDPSRVVLESCGETGCPMVWRGSLWVCGQVPC